uniref:Palmitoyltransferase n=1 Tax=Taeniopygia guttata TaxID=59729 RepID=A0A674GA94_TAEGU
MRGAEGGGMALWRGLRCCRRAFAWLPVLLIALLLLWSYYGYVCELCLDAEMLWDSAYSGGSRPPGGQQKAAAMTVSNPVEKVAYLVVFHILFVLFVWTYWKSVFTLPIQPGKKFHMSYADQERYENEERPEVQRQILAEIARKLPVYTRTGSGGIRFCDRCQLIKPDRCHHCSVCAMCVLKMDHHCPWVNNCIGFSNYKFFLLFLAYSLLYCLYIAATVFKYFIKYWTGELTNGRSKFHILFLLFVAIMFFVSLMFLFGYHCWLVSRNRSTLEAFSAPVFQNGPDKNGFNLGFVKNLQQVFGEEKKLWLLPIASSQGDGHFFPMRALSEARNPLLTNEEQWEEDGLDEEPQGSGEASSLAIERET